MYAKIFRQIYDGTLAHNWQALITFQQLLILSDRHGEVDMTLTAIQRITNIPMDILEIGIAQLSAPDPQSRSKTNGGCRIVSLDVARDWGWRIVNKEYYNQLQSKEDKKEKDRIRMAKKRSEIKIVANSRKESQAVADVAYVDVDVDKDKDTTLSGNPDLISGVIDFLNLTLGTNYKKTTKATKVLILARSKEGFTLEDFKIVIIKKYHEWYEDTKMKKFLRPETLFGTKFESYLNQTDIEPPKDPRSEYANMSFKETK